jgi:DNA-binding NarL/FixJ family response regulator
MANGIKSVLPIHDVDLQVYETEQELLEQIDNLKNRLLFIEYSFSGHGTDAFISRLKKQHRHLQIAVWTPVLLPPRAAARFIIAGADSFVFIREAKEKLQKHFKKIVDGIHHCPKEVREIAENEMMNKNDRDLTPKQIEVLKYALAGYTNKEIENKLCISNSTLRTHKNALYKKAHGKKYPDLLRLATSRNVFSWEELGDALYVDSN